MIKFFLFAAGEGKRAKPLSLYKPKPLFPIIDKPIIKIISKDLTKEYSGFINTYYKKEMIIKEFRNNEKIKIIEEDKLSGNLVLKKSLDFNFDNLLITNSDTLMKIPLKEIENLANKEEITIFIKKTNHSPYNKLIIQGNHIIDIIKNKKEGYFYTGTAIISRDIVKSLNNKNIIRFIKDNKIKVNFYEYKGYWYDFGTPKDYYSSVFNFIKLLTNNKLKNSLSKNVIIDNNSNVLNSIVWDNTKINYSNITNCIVLNNLEINNKDYNNSIITQHGIYNF